jgi:hypothetical protein
VTYAHRLLCLLHWKEDCEVLQSLLDLVGLIPL